MQSLRKYKVGFNKDWEFRFFHIHIWKLFLNRNIRGDLSNLTSVKLTVKILRYDSNSVYGVFWIFIDTEKQITIICTDMLITSPSEDEAILGLFKNKPSFTFPAQVISLLKQLWQWIYYKKKTLQNRYLTRAILFCVPCDVCPLKIPSVIKHALHLISFHNLRT